MKPIYQQNNKELLKTYLEGSDSQSLQVIEECFNRFRYYVEIGKIPSYDTAYDTHMHNSSFRDRDTAP